MRLLYDQNLPHRFVASLAEHFPDSTHVRTAGLATATDREIWDYARQHDYTIMSKDADFHQLSFLYGAPPKTIWLQCGNSSVAELEGIISGRVADMRNFLHDDAGALLVIRRS